LSNPATNSYEVSGSVTSSVFGPTPVKRAFASGSTIATHEIVAAQAGLKIRVLAFFATTADGLNLTFKSGSTTISGNLAVTGVMSTYCPHGWFETAAGEALGFAIDAAEATSVHVVYVEVV
jgi:hypothetical protein